MAKNNKSYRIRTTVGREADTFLDVHLDQDYDMLEILSLKIREKDVYKLHNSDYGVVVGRVIANGNFGVPNAKISVFIPADANNSDMEMWNLYPYTSTTTKNNKNIRYNLLPDEPVGDCHQAVGTFPNKTYMLDNDSFIEVFDEYYIYTTRTNAAGDYLICGVPTGMQTLHMDLDLSDCGILSQRPRDFVYKGYTIEQFENPNKFKKDENLDGLSQIFTQNQPVYVRPFWGADENGETIGITRADIEISFKFEPTCVFLGSAISDNASNGVSKKCVPTNQMGYMEELTTGEGTIEMIRKTPGGNVEEFSIKGNHVIDGNGVWCYQIPMNLDYMMTDEYGNMVPTDDPEKGLPTRTRVRFRASLTDMENSTKSFHRAKYLIPNNPEIEDKKVDYSFGTYTDEKSFRDLFWNGVYTVKSYIPRFQKSKRWKSERFSGIKGCNHHGTSNPMPYNNMRVKIPLVFAILCIFVKLFIKIVNLVNRILGFLLGALELIPKLLLGPFYIFAKTLQNIGIRPFSKIGKNLETALDSLGIGSEAIKRIINEFKIHCVFIGDGLCPDLEGWYFAPGCGSGIKMRKVKKELMDNTLAAAIGTGDLENGESSINSGEFIDETSLDAQNIALSETTNVCLTTNIDYLVNCFEMNLAQEFRVINFDFYNDWVNGVLYFPRWMRKVKRKKTYKFSLSNGIKTYYKDKVLGCMNSNNSRVKKSRWYTQQCAVSYKEDALDLLTQISNDIGCTTSPGLFGSLTVKRQVCHKKPGMVMSSVFGKKSGLVTEETTMLGQYVYYLKPCEWNNSEKRTLLFATDIVLLGTLNDCDENGLPQAFKFLNNSSYILPTNLALTTMDDDAYIYTEKGGTVCSSSNVETISDDFKRYLETIEDPLARLAIEATYKKNRRTSDRGRDGIRRVNPSYQATFSAYSQTDGDQIIYEENDDPIPITEAAGISWNYSGPGQEDVEAGKLESPADLLERLTKNPKVNYVYYPGGHFLGLSCVNSETNIKSCVNLQRICELGASMSQRREEVRGYDEEGNPKYRYYVPTGLISNVDIESATFRSMFATLNHNKLVATRTNENTGYKQYDLKFLRPDGFDGALSSYVHRSGGTPYNRKVEEDWLEDAEKNGIFKKLFGSLWSKPDDYDPEETEYTERRTVEACINDYYIFRFGLNSLNKDEQLRHFLKKDVNGYALPQYENSFYFYFGLRDGATAIDEFKKQFFSECQPNIISRTPAISVTEKISDDFTVISATLNIENMYPGYSITVKDLTTGVESDPYPIETDDEKINLGEYIEILIGHEYLVSVTDSLGRIIEKRFIFGASVMNTDAESVNFRCPGTTTTGDPKKGGYIKINDKVKVKKVEKKISEDSISVVIKKIENGTETAVSASEGSYTDMSGILWHLYYVPSVGQYNVYLDYQGASVLVYSTALVDNTEVNLFVGCDYLSYKPEFVPDTGNYLPSMNLKDFIETDWYNDVKFQNTDPDSWLLRHTFYRQYSNDALGHNCSIYNKGTGSLAIYGHPETGTMYAASNTDTGDTGQTNFVMDGPSCYRGYFTQYEGYSIEPTNTFIPTMYWSQGLGEDYTGHEYRRTFDAMTYTEDGRAAADATGLRVLSYTYSNTDGKIVLTYDGGLTDKHGCIVVFENGIIIFPIVNEADKTLTAYLDYDAYPGGVTEEILGMATIYPTMMVPVIYKPFYGIVSAATWEVQALYLPDVGNNETVPEKMALPPSFKFEADLYNGLTFNEHFYSGDTADGPYDTYLIFDNKKDFYNRLTNPDDAPLLKTETDWMWKRKATFANGKWDNGCGREIETTAQAKLNPNFTTLEYYITEGMPNITEMQSNVKSGRYSNGFDQAVLGDICDMGSAFFNDIKIKAMEESSGLTGPCAVYVEGPLPENISLYATKNTLFNRSSNPLTVTEDQINIYCYGTYNENIKYDIKGTVTTVKKSGSGSEKYYYSVTNERGERVQKTATSVADLYNNGITLLYKYTLDDTYKKAITSINSTIASAEKIELDEILTPENQTNYKLLEPGNAYNALIAVYDKPEPQGSKNRMIVYKLYPIGALDLMFPASQGGVPAYLGLSESSNILGPYSDEAQTIAISVKTNVRFSVSIESTDTWISITQPDYPENTISIEVNLSTNTTGAERRGTIYLQCTDPNVDLPPVPITIVQSKDRITPLEEEIEELRPPVTGRT